MFVLIQTLTPVYFVPRPQLSCHPSQPITSLQPVLTLGSRDSFILREASAPVLTSSWIVQMSSSLFELTQKELKIDHKYLCLLTTETFSDLMLSSLINDFSWNRFTITTSELNIIINQWPTCPRPLLGVGGTAGLFTSALGGCSTRKYQHLFTVLNCDPNFVKRLRFCSERLKN